MTMECGKPLAEARGEIASGYVTGGGGGGDERPERGLEACMPGRGRGGFAPPRLPLTTVPFCRSPYSSFLSSPLCTGLGLSNGLPRKGGASRVTCLRRWEGKGTLRMRWNGKLGGDKTFQVGEADDTAWRHPCLCTLYAGQPRPEDDHHQAARGCDGLHHPTLSLPSHFIHRSTVTAG